MGSMEIRPGLWKHKQEGLQYNVLGNAIRTQSLMELSGFQTDFVGTALFVEGYEENHQVLGYPIMVFRLKDTPHRTKLRFFKVGDYDFDPPDNIVIYKQMDKGEKYGEGQLWWRSPENFAVNFTPLNL